MKKPIKPTERKQRLPNGAVPLPLTLKEAVEVVQAIYEQAGGDASFDVLSRLTNNSTSSSTFHKKTYTLKNLGLIEIEGRIVKLPELALSIVAPQEKKEKFTALKTAFLNIDVFKGVYERYAGRILPQDEYLVNTFVEFAPKEHAERWMNQFKDAAVFAGLLFEREDGKFQVVEGIGTNGESEKDVKQFVQEKETETRTVSEIMPKPFSFPAQEKNNFQILIEILNTDMSDEEQKAVWTLIQYLKKKEADVL